MYGRMMIDLEGPWVTATELELLNHDAIGGILLFQKNFQSREQLTELITKIRQDVTSPLIIAVDHEGGRVWRFKEGFIKLPAMRSLGQLYEKTPGKAKTLIRKMASLMALELMSCGLDLSFAPVLDLDYGRNTVIGDRSFGAQDEKVIALAQEFILGFENIGMAAVGKHFPGHGGCYQDSHTHFATDERTLAELEKDLEPFRRLAPFLKGIMAAHVSYPHVAFKPASQSEYWLQNILRQDLLFKGVIISDCLSMVGANHSLPAPQRVQESLRAGCDMVILTGQCHDGQQQSYHDMLHEVLTALPETLYQCPAIEGLAGNFQLAQTKYKEGMPRIQELAEL